MKRVIDGRSYNTDTSTVIARADAEDGDWRDGGYGTRVFWTLYQTRKGAFFLHSATTTRNRDLNNDEWQEDSHDLFEPMTAEKAQEWVMTGDVELVSNVFGDPPDADADEAAAATIYIRVPRTLKEQAEKAAEKDSLSLNAWALRCVERCLRA